MTYQNAVMAAQTACDALSALLTARYGKRAGDMRYRKPETVEIANAMRVYLEASERRQTAWLATMGPFQDKPETDRETVIERLDEECDALFGSLVRNGRIDQYTVDDLIATAQPCAVILKVAQEDAWVEDDCGLWDGLTFGVLASITYFSLRNLLYERLKRQGHDTNDDYPFARTESAEIDA